jgi:hypothetical protein
MHETLVFLIDIGFKVHREFESSSSFVPGTSQTRFGGHRHRDAPWQKVGFEFFEIKAHNQA